MNTKIYGDHTRRTDGLPLCVTCRSAMTVAGTRFGDDRVVCTAGLGTVRFPVTACSSYDDKRLVAVWELEQTAWRWMSTRFVSPSEFARLREEDAPTVVEAGATGASARRGWWARLMGWGGS